MRIRIVTRRITFLTATLLTLIHVISITSFYLSEGIQQFTYQYYQKYCKQYPSFRICRSRCRGSWLDRMIVNNTIPQWIDTWISKGEFDQSSYLYHGIKSTSGDMCTRFDQIKFDIVYTWVNGSDERHRKLRELYNSNDGQEKDLRNLENRYRDYDELRYSIRSVEGFFGRFVNKIFIIATNFENKKVGESPSKIMQVPTWLNTTWKDCITGEPRVQMVKHSEIFTDPSVLPTFNSLAIESQMMNIRDLSDQILYLNDDQFLGRTLSPADFWTPLYGQVFHIEHHLTVPPDHREELEEAGEWYALYHSNKLLSKRFGPRHRPYVSHTTHTLSTSILRSIVSEFPEEFLSTSSHRFRNAGPDLHTTFLFTHYVMEKHREALLRSFLIYKMDVNHNMKYELSERKAILKVFGNDGYTPSIRRETLKDYETVLEEAGIYETRETKYMWSSADGYAYSILSPLTMDDRRPTSLPFFFNPEKHPSEARSCRLDFGHCFGSEFLSEDENIVVDVESVFAEVAVRKIECGDCIIQHLIAKSGVRGLEAFLPSSGEKETSEDDNEVIDSDAVKEYKKGVSTTKNREDINNSTHTSEYHESESATSDLMFYRTLAITEISRYSYVIGGSSFRFIYLDYPVQTWTNLNSLFEQKPSSFCINDEVKLNIEDLKKIKEYLNQFLREYFKNASLYENSGESDNDNGIWDGIKRILIP